MIFPNCRHIFNSEQKLRFDFCRAVSTDQNNYTKIFSRTGLHRLFPRQIYRITIFQAIQYSAFSLKQSRTSDIYPLTKWVEVHPRRLVIDVKHGEYVRCHPSERDMERALQLLSSVSQDKTKKSRVSAHSLGVELFGRVVTGIGTDGELDVIPFTIRSGGIELKTVCHLLGVWAGLFVGQHVSPLNPCNRKENVDLPRRSSRPSV